MSKSIAFLSLERRIDALFARYTKPGSPGAVVAVAQGGEVEICKGYGLASIELGVPIGPKTRFRIASVSKQFTVSAALMLAAEGKLDLEASPHQYLPELKKRIEGLTPDALKLLMRFNWPGNIRELENALERAALLAEDRLISSDDLHLGDQSTLTDVGEAAPVVKLPPSGIPLEDIERQALVEALKMSNWVQKDAAELLHISPRVMNYKIKTLNIEMPRRRVLASA